MMRRRGRSPTPHIGTNTTGAYDNDDDDDDTMMMMMMDTDDQDALVESLELDAIQQTKDFSNYFGFVVGFAVLASLVYPLLCHEQCFPRMWTCGCHAMVSSATHVGAIWLSSSSSSSSSSLEPPFQQPQRQTTITTTTTTIISLTVCGLIGIPLLFWGMGNFADDMEHFHIGLIVGNIVTLVGSVLLRWDAWSTKRALEELHGAKYEHKSL